MKKVLITGAGSYIGTSFEKWLQQWPEEYEAVTVDMIGNAWREVSFAGFDAVFHVAGIAHSDSGKITEEKKALYYRVNTDLTIETAKKAKADGVKQFIFMSSIIVFGESAPMGKEKIITKDTIPQPANCYGDSKLQAENGILPLQDDCFNVVVIRPPMIYGKGCKGNYQTLVKFAKKFPVFPDIVNQRSMLYVGNLCEFVRLMISNHEKGVFHPQNAEYVCTAEMVRLIGEAHGKQVRLVKWLNPLVRVAGCFTGVVDKAFGSLVYEMINNECYSGYWIHNTVESINETEKLT
jgi:Nucleoside-diphosphate-sugar epimerases